MKLKEAMLVYNPGTAQVDVVPWPDRDRRSRDYRYSFLACFLDFHKCSPQMRKMLLFVTALQAVVRDEVDPKALHNALLKVDEYRRHIALDMQRPMDVNVLIHQTQREF